MKHKDIWKSTSARGNSKCQVSEGGMVLKRLWKYKGGQYCSKKAARRGIGIEEIRPDEDFAKPCRSLQFDIWAFFHSNIRDTFGWFGAKK